jgi:hypothetical protein
MAIAAHSTTLNFHFPPGVSPLELGGNRVKLG